MQKISKYTLTTKARKYVQILQNSQQNSNSKTNPGKTKQLRSRKAITKYKQKVKHKNQNHNKQSNIKSNTIKSNPYTNKQNKQQVHRK